MSSGMRHVSPIVERFKAARRRSARMRTHPRLPQSADDVVYHFMRLLKQRLSCAVKVRRNVRGRCSTRRNGTIHGPIPGSRRILCLSQGTL